MAGLKITMSNMVFEARLETEKAPRACATFAARLPFESKVVHMDGTQDIRFEQA